MSTITRLHCGIVVLCAMTSAIADVPVMLTTGITTTVDLTNTDFEKKKGLLDCGLRLEGVPSDYKLVYSLGTVPVPDAAVKKAYGKSHRSIAVHAMIAGLPVTHIFVRYNSSSKNYRLPVICPTGYPKCYGEVAYELYVAAPALHALRSLQAVHRPGTVLDSSADPNINPNAIMLTDRPGLTSPAMDGLGGAGNRRNTIIHYVCGTEN